MKKTNILFAAVDIGFRISHYTSYIKENYPDVGKVESFSKYVLPKEHYQTSYTYECPVDKLPKWRVYTYTIYFFIKTLFTYNTIHFFSGETILTRKLRPIELSIYKLCGKNIIMHFVGADIRSEKFLEEKRDRLIEYLNGGLLKSELSEKHQKRLIRDARKYADRIIVSTPDLLKIIPEADYLPVFLDLKSIDISIPKKSKKTSKIKILHSPSGFQTKGSEYIHEVLNCIKDRNDNVEIITPMLQNKHKKVYALTRYELLNTFKEVDIVVDQMLIGWYGLKTIEALAFGVNVVCYIDDNYKNNLFEDTPIHNASILTLEEKLNSLISIIEKGYNKKEIQEEQLAWINKNHTFGVYKDYFKEVWFK